MGKLLWCVNSHINITHGHAKWATEMRIGRGRGVSPVVLGRISPTLVDTMDKIEIATDRECCQILVISVLHINQEESSSSIRGIVHGGRSLESGTSGLYVTISSQRWCK